MILVDTSVIVDFLRGYENPPAKRFERILDHGVPFGIAEFTYQEVLQGAASPTEFKTLQNYLNTQTIYGLTRGVSSYAAAAHLYFRCRQKGITPRSSLDCLICQVALEHRLQLLHHDADFTRIASVVKELRILTHDD